jgi:hypothetical protein
VGLDIKRRNKLINFKVKRTDESLTVGYIFKAGVMFEQVKDELTDPKFRKALANNIANEMLSNLYNDINQGALERLFELKKYANGGQLITPENILRTNVIITELIEIMSGSRELKNLSGQILKELK